MGRYDPRVFEMLNSANNPFGEFSVSQRTPIIQLNGSYDILELRDTIRKTDNADITSVNSEYLLKTEGVGEKATMLSASRGRYVPGYAAEAGVGVRIPEIPEGDTIMRAGYFDLIPGTQDINDGAVFEKRADSASVAIYRDGELVERVKQVDWNLAPGRNIDLADGWILQILFVYYGYGPIWFRLVSPEQEKVIDLHKINVKGAPALENSNLQVGAQIVSEQETEAELYLSGRQFAILGVPKFKERIVSHFRQGVNVPTDNFVPIMSFRRKTERRAVPVQIASFEAITNNDIRTQWRINSDINDDEWITPDGHNADEVALEVNVDATTIDVDTGLKVDSDLVLGGATGQARQFKEDDTVTDIPDEYIVTLCARSIEGSSATATFICKMTEER